MRKWDYKIDIKQHIGDGTDLEAIKKSAEGVVSELKKLPENLGGYYYIEVFDNILIECTFKEPFEDALLGVFNYALDELYDWADYNNVWLGLV